MAELTLDRLRKAVDEDAAIRRVQKLQPAGGPGDKLFPPTYPGERTNDPARHVFETRRIGGNDVRCVLIDSVQSQANRLEEAILNAIRENRIQVPYLSVNFIGQKDTRGTDISDLGEVTSFDAPHRVFDAIIRDSNLNGTKFTETSEYKKLLLAKPTNSVQVFALSPNSLLFGAWNSTGEGGGLGSKFTRCIVSEIVGVNADEGQKSAVRIDPLGIRASVKIVGGPLDWSIASGGKGEKSYRPSEINHSNVISNVVPGGVTIDYALHTAVITCAGLRRLRFPGTKDEAAGRTFLAALGLFALTEQDRGGYSLRSRCDLVCDGKEQFEFVLPNGSTEKFGLDADGARDCLKRAAEAVKQAGFPWSDKPIVLTPQPRLVELVALSRAKALEGEAEGPTT